MEIVDSQVHLNRFGTNWQTVEPAVIVEYAVMAMEAVGVNAVLIDEFAGWDEKKRYLPGYVLPNGAMRSQLPFSELAMSLRPDRFAYAAHVDPNDPEMERLVAEVRQKPGGLCLRVVPLPETGQLQAFEQGGYDALLAAAQTHGVPIFCFMPGRARLLQPVLRKFTELCK